MTRFTTGRLLRYFALACIAATSLCVVASARPVRLWSESELWAEADVVVLAKAQSTKDIDRVPSDPPPPETWVAVATTFEIQAVLKGKPKDKELAMRHHRYQAKEGQIAVVDGPSFVEFTPGKHQYLMFLKEEKVDDKVHYEPLTGQYDPDGSFRRAEPYHISNERDQPAPAAVEKPATKDAAEKPSVVDGKLGITVSVQADDRTITATDKAGKTLWSVDVIKVAGLPGRSAPIVRHLSIKDGQLTAVYGKHHFATFELKSGKLLSAGSD